MFIADIGNWVRWSLTFRRLPSRHGIAGVAAHGMPGLRSGSGETVLCGTKPQHRQRASQCIHRQAQKLSRPMAYSAGRRPSARDDAPLPGTGPVKVLTTEGTLAVSANASRPHWGTWKRLEPDRLLF
jgi:hypothetical protein